MMKRLLFAALLALLPCVASADVLYPSLGGAAAIGDTNIIACYQGSEPVLGCTASQLKTYMAVPAAANPTGTAGSTAVNGSASTFMRSDGAPAVAVMNATTAGLVPTPPNDSTKCLSGAATFVACGGAAGTPVVFTGATAGAANTYTIASPSPSGYTLTDQNVVCGSISATNTGASTLNVNSTGATAIKKQTTLGLSALSGGELVASNTQYCFQYNATGTAYVLITTLGSSVSSGASSQSVTQAQWDYGQTFVVNTAGQTFTLPVATSLSPNGGIIIITVGQSTTLAPNAADGINGGTIGTSVTIPANYVAFVTSTGSSGTGAISVPLGLVQGSNITITQNANGTTTLAAGGGGTVLTNYRGGLTLSNDGTSPNTVIDIAAGIAADTTANSYMTLTAITKNANTAFTAGTGNGCLDSNSGATLAASSTYSIYVIAKANGASPDALCVKEAGGGASPSLPATYTLDRRIGAIITDGASHIRPFHQRGDFFAWDAPVLDLNNVTLNNGSTLANQTLTLVPLGVITEATIGVACSNTTGVVNCFIVAPTVTSVTGIGAQLRGDATNTINAAEVHVLTDASQRVGMTSDAAGGTTGLYATVYGYRDFLGTP